MAPISKRKQSIREVVKERERQRKIRKMQEERGWESSDEEEDVTAIGLLQPERTRNADSVSASDKSDNSESESEDDEVLVSEEEELEEVDESAFEKLIKSQSRMLSWMHDFYLADMLQSTSNMAKTNIGGEMTWAIIRRKLQFQSSTLHFLAVKLSLHLTTHPTIALMQLMRSELRI